MTTAERVKVAVTSHAKERFLERFGGPADSAHNRIAGLLADAHRPTEEEWLALKRKRRWRHKVREHFRILGSIVFVVRRQGQSDTVVTCYRSQELMED
jgi:hypothetical protein